MELSKIVTMSALKAFGIAALIYCCLALGGDSGKPKFRVIAFYTAKEDQAHISFVREAERWFPQMAAKYELYGVGALLLAGSEVHTLATIRPTP